MQPGFLRACVYFAKTIRNSPRLLTMLWTASSFQVCRECMYFDLVHSDSSHWFEGKFGLSNPLVGADGRVVSDEAVSASGK
jgi:hypothetical protein